MQWLQGWRCLPILQLAVQTSVPPAQYSHRAQMSTPPNESLRRLQVLAIRPHRPQFLQPATNLVGVAQFQT